jgi:hypothetical protein
VVEREEDWYTDPFERHEARWMSDGTPTKLARDAGVESYDDPPDEEPSHTPTRVQEEQAANGSDLLRAGDSESGGQSLNERMAEAGQFGATSRSPTHARTSSSDSPPLRRRSRRPDLS